MNTKPLIGVTMFRKDSGRNYNFLAITEAYASALIEAGAVPIMIPLGLRESDLDDLRSRLDAIMLTGGGDIDPAIYNGEPHPNVQEVDPERDEVEIFLARKVVDAGQPFLGICRGLQIVNVAFGGTLYTDIADQFPGAIRHDYWPDYPRDKIAHPIRVEEDTVLSKILDSSLLDINSLHHQGVKDLAPNLKPSAYAPDGLIEAVEIQDHPFGLAVQWHPECLSGQHRMPGLFKSFVQAAGNGRE